MPEARRDLIGPPLPPLAVRAWSVFRDLDETRVIGEGGVRRLAYTEVAAYCDLMAITLTPLEIALLAEADRATVSALRAQLREATAPAASPDD